MSTEEKINALKAHRHTAHGHPCCGSAPVGGRPSMVARCGGPAICPKCATEAGTIHARELR